MPREDVARLFRAAQADVGLRKHLSTAPNVETFIQMAEKLGYQFTEEEWREMTRFSVEEFKSDISEIPGI
jgi:predicted ribosomally synthesized peptide with nif11-like leader